ncbi:hypothetical protein LEN26_004008 [Aphanomyces euteiches]|nr:hypothetical protein AeMF1_019774 [Aphanomyces euteiches]KAH9150825.1 hypothetical protein LEN26_004008 [Aphanomyces euteiches]KAH9194898.1 hypothetical protein AeNC1_003120 [Aphanomyces euteiches]
MAGGQSAGPTIGSEMEGVVVSSKVAPAGRNPKQDLYHSRRSAWESFVAFMSFGAAYVFLNIYFSGAVIAAASLAGSTGGLDGSTSIYMEYKSPKLPFFLADMKERPDMLKAKLAKIASRAVFIQDPLNASTSYELSNKSCAFVNGSKFIPMYNPEIFPIIMSIVVNGLNKSTGLDLKIMIDCTFEGITLYDTSMQRFYVVDPNLTFIGTITSTVTNIIRPALRQFTSATSIFFVNSSIDDIQTKAGGGYVRPINPDKEVGTIMAIGYPFENVSLTPFKFVKANEDGSITANLTLSNGNTEIAMLVGRAGNYRDSASVTGHYSSFTIRRPTDAVEDLYKVQYVGVPVTKNAWAWGHIIVNAYGMASIGFSIIASCLVGYHTNKRTRHGFFNSLPDVSRQVTMSVIMHGVLSILSCALDKGWALYEWADVSYKFRNDGPQIKHDEATYLVYHARAMLFSWVVMLAYPIVRVLRLNVVLPVVVAFIVIGNTYLKTFNSAPWALCEQASRDFYNADLSQRVVPTRPSALDLWSFHPLLEWNIPFILNEVSCFVWSLVGSILVFVVVKLVKLLGHCWPHNHVRPKWATSFQSSLSILRVESAFVFENRKAYHSCHGLHAAFSKRQLHNQQVHASPEWLWELGYVIVDNDRLIHLDDVPKLILNCILRDELFYVYGYAVFGNLLGRELNHLLLEDIRLVELFRLSLLPLRQDEPLGHARSTHDLYERRQKSRRGILLSQRK